MKEQNVSMQMNEQLKELVKTIKVWLKEQKVDSLSRFDRNKKLANAIQLQFNCSDALILAPQALFYSQLLQVLRNCTKNVKKPIAGDPLCASIATYADPEDLIYDIMQGMVN